MPFEPICASGGSLLPGLKSRGGQRCLVRMACVDVGDLGLGLRQLRLTQFNDAAQPQLISSLREVQREIRLVQELPCHIDAVIRGLRRKRRCSHSSRHYRRHHLSSGYTHHAERDVEIVQQFFLDTAFGVWSMLGGQIHLSSHEEVPKMEELWFTRKMEGLWYAHFTAGEVKGDGIAVLRDGEILGGDPIHTYSGSYTTDGQLLYANVRVCPHSTADLQADLNGPVSLFLKGSMDGENANVSGYSDQKRDRMVAVELHRAL